MPGFDGTGPVGQGPRTGGGRGYCPPVAGSYYGGAPVVYGVGRGGIPYGGGRGRMYGGGRGGRGRCWAYPFALAPAPVQMSKDQEIEWLQAQSQALQAELNQFQTRLADLTAEK